MTLIMTGCNKKYGYILTDTRITNTIFGISDNYNKIFYSEKDNSFICGYHLVSLHDEFIKIHKNSNIIHTDDILNNFKSAYNLLEPSPYLTAADLNSTVLVYMFFNSDLDVKIYFLNHNDSGIIDEKEIILYPTDILQLGEVKNPTMHNFLDETGDIYTILEKRIEEFISYSEKSNGVSNICCCALMSKEFGNVYFKDNMYRLWKLIKDRKPITNALADLVRDQNI